MMIKMMTKKMIYIMIQITIHILIQIKIKMMIQIMSQITIHIMIQIKIKMMTKMMIQMTITMILFGSLYSDALDPPWLNHSLLQLTLTLFARAYLRLKMCTFPFISPGLLSIIS